MDNSDGSARLALVLDLDAMEELPREEALVRLYELRDSYGRHAATLQAHGAMREHVEQYGHLLRQGCCAEQPERLRSA